jgi:hypothetical protein
MAIAVSVMLKTKVIDDLSRIKWHERIRIVSCYISKGVIAFTTGPTSPKT